MSENEEVFSVLPRHIRDIDGEALFFFVCLFHTATIQEAADKCGVSLSSANRLLAKLRTYFNDPLFQRSGSKMKPTSFAQNRLGEIEKILKSLKTIQEPEDIEPSHLQRTVRIATYDNALAILICGILNPLRKRLPLVLFKAEQASEAMFGDLEENRLDLIFYARQGVFPNIHSAPMLTTPYVCVVRKGHRLEKIVKEQGYVEKEDLWNWQQVLVNSQPDRNRSPNSPANGYFNPPSAQQIALILPFFLAVPLAVQNTDYYSIVPKVTAEMAFSQDKLSLLPLAPSSPTLTTRMAWHERLHTDPGSQMIRSVLKEIIREHFPDYRPQSL